VVQGPDDHWYLMGFLNTDAQGQFIGTISDPLRLMQAADGSLSL